MGARGGRCIPLTTRTSTPSDLSGVITQFAHLATDAVLRVVSLLRIPPAEAGIHPLVALKWQIGGCMLKFTFPMSPGWGKLMFVSFLHRITLFDFDFFLALLASPAV